MPIPSSLKENEIEENFNINNGISNKINGQEDFSGFTFEASKTILNSVIPSSVSPDHRLRH